MVLEEFWVQGSGSYKMSFNKLQSRLEDE